jgi:urocanate hydratase
VATVAKTDVGIVHIKYKMRKNKFFKEILEGIPKKLPKKYFYNNKENHAPNRKDILKFEEKKLALRNALRYFPENQHEILIKEFHHELNKYGRIYMYRFKPSYKITAKNINSYPHKSKQAAAII